MRIRHALRFWVSVSPYAAVGLVGGLLLLLLRSWVTR